MVEGRGQNVSSLMRLADYLFGRHALIGIASFMLLVISGYATWHGMNDFIVGVSSAPASGKEVAGLSVTSEMLVIAICIALTFLMWLALREALGAQRKWHERLIAIPLYVFLFLWSVGFGYGFWWSLIAGEEATKSGLAGLQEDARDASTAIAARLEAVRVQLGAVVSWSDGQMAREESSGGSCGVASGAGRGPLYNARRSVRDSIATLRESVDKSWLGPVQGDLEQLKQVVSGLEGATVEERQRRFEAMANQIRGRARSIAARSNELGRSTASEMRAIADAVAITPGSPGFSCHDPTLAQRLRQAAEQAAQQADVRLRQASFNEGPAGVANAIKNLWENVGAYMSSLGSYVISGGTSTGGARAGTEPITGRDLIALLATIGIDLGLLALAMLSPPAVAPLRHDGLVDAQARLHLPTGPVVRQISAAIRTAVARAPGADLEWVRRHFLHHNGASYFVIPNLYSVDQKKEGEELRALAMNQLAGVLDDLRLVRALNERELRRFGEEEKRDSYSDLSPFRKGREDHAVTEEDRRKISAKPIRNHGLLSKAQRVLDITGWSESAQGDVEVFRLVDVEGLTPLLMVLHEAADDDGGEGSAAGTKPVAGEPQKALPAPRTA
jgi:hypothetical protein